MEVKGIPIHSASAAYFNKLATAGELWDIAFGLWSPSYIDPFAYLNLLFDRRFDGSTNFIRSELGRVRPADAQRGPPAARQRSQRRVRGARRPARPRPGTDRGGRLPQRGDARVEARRLHCAQTVLDLTAVCLGTLRQTRAATQTKPSLKTTPEVRSRPRSSRRPGSCADRCARRSCDPTLATQIAPAPLAIADGPSPTGIVDNRARARHRCG